MLNILPVRPAVRQPRSIVTLNGTAVTPVSWDADTGTFYQADTFRCSLALSGMPKGIDLNFFATAPKIEAEIFVGFPPDPSNFSTSQLTSIFVGRVDDIDTTMGPNVVSLSGRDLAAQLIDEKSSEKFVNQTASGIATALAQKYGLTPVVTATEGRAGRLYQSDHVRLQDEKTPWDVLTWLAREQDFVVYVKGRELHFEPRPTGQGDPYVFQWTPGGGAGQQSAPIFNGSRLSMSRSLTLAKDIKVTVRSWHSKQGKAFTATAVRQKKGATDVQQYSYTFPGLTLDQAQQRANKILEELTRHEMKFSVEGPAEIILGKADTIQLTGTGSAWDQTYFPASINRSFGAAEGFTWRIDAKNHNPASEPNL